MDIEPDLETLLQGEWDRCAAEGTPLAVMIVAPDHTALGHEEDVRRQIERALRVHCARDRDVITRRVNGSFVAILPDTPPPGARHVGEQIVDALRHAPEAAATVSVGVAGVVPSAGDEPSSLLARATRSLRAAQEQGGNRCAGGGSGPAPAPKGTLAQLRDLLPKKKDPERKRRTD